MATDVNEYRGPHTFRTGDQVLINMAKLPIRYTNVSSTSRKLQHRNAGPFTLSIQFGVNTFEIIDFLSHWMLHNIFTVDRFKAYTMNRTRSMQPSPSLRFTVLHGDESEVEAILDHRGTTIGTLEC